MLAFSHALASNGWAPGVLRAVSVPWITAPNTVFVRHGWRVAARPRNVLSRRHFADLSPQSTEALRNIKSALNTPVKRVQLTKKEKKNLQGNPRRYILMGGRPEFHNIDRNRNGRIFEPVDTFEIVISSSKNNCWITAVNKSRGFRTVFTTNAGNIGQRKVGLEPGFAA